MAGEKSVTPAITQAATEATKAAVQVVVVARAETGAGPWSMPVSMESKLGWPILQQSTNDVSIRYKYAEA